MAKSKALLKTTPKPFVFVLMPFDPAFDDAYKLGILPSCQEAGAFCERVDEQHYTGSILERIYNQISKADIIISDMSTKNPNVFYETGYAHALGKKVILLTQDANDIPFDLKHYAHIVYGKSVAKLKAELKTKVDYFIKNPDRKQAVGPDAIKCFVNGTDIDVMSRLFMDYVELWHISLAFHNPGNSILDTSNIQFGFTFPRMCGIPYLGEDVCTKIPNDLYLFIMDAPPKLLPQGWHYETISITITNFSLLLALPPVICSVRIYSEMGMKESNIYISTR
jgi:hypothetical protein